VEGDICLPNRLVRKLPVRCNSISREMHLDIGFNQHTVAMEQRSHAFLSLVSCRITEPAVQVQSKNLPERFGSCIENVELGVGLYPEGSA
jgi:hypothetical protein